LKNSRGDFSMCGELLLEREWFPLSTKHTTHMKTLIKAGAMLALIAGLGLATVSAAESCKACKGCAKSCNSCVKCSDGKCASCCK